MQFGGASRLGARSSAGHSNCLENPALDSNRNFCELRRVTVVHDDRRFVGQARKILLDGLIDLGFHGQLILHVQRERGKVDFAPQQKGLPDGDNFRYSPRSLQMLVHARAQLFQREGTLQPELKQTQSRMNCLKDGGGAAQPG